MINAEIMAGVRHFLLAYVGIRNSDHVLISYTPDSTESAAWVGYMLGEASVSHEIVCMLPIVDAGIELRLEEAAQRMPPDCDRMVLLSFEESTMSHDAAFRSVVNRVGPDRCVVFRAISASAALFSSALMADPDDIERRNAEILSRLSKANRLRVTTPSGSDLSVELDNTKNRWISNRGKWRPGRLVILPAGEVATYPSSVNGRFVADFAFNLNAITGMDTRLSERPVMVDIRDGKLHEMHCPDADLAAFFEKCFTTHCAKNVGEFGIGTNPQISRAIAMNSHINERRPGVHFGFGQHNQDRAVVPYFCDLHLDLIAAGGSIWVDDSSDPLDLENITYSYAKHPDDCRDEDVFSPKQFEELECVDCCGVFEGGELRIFEVSERAR